MTEVGARYIPLYWDVFVTPGIPTVTSDLPPGTKQRMWSPISSTLIYGKRDAVLVDAFITVEQAHALVDWVAASGKNLTTIFITHDHGDYFFGIGALLDRSALDAANLAVPLLIVSREGRDAGPQQGGHARGTRHQRFDIRPRHPDDERTDWRAFPRPIAANRRPSRHAIHFRPRSTALGRVQDGFGNSSWHDIP
jgi:glyoxylase-like metal-dependent hydrolase (beta-lactamase superfamily II)